MQIRPAQVPDLHGSARWLEPNEFAAAGLIKGGGVVLGKVHDGNFLSFQSDGHLLVFAPSGAGKGIGFVQPNLALYPGSMIVLDPKGENTAVSARHRRDNLHQRVVVLDPFKESDFPSDSYNPLTKLSYLPPADIIGEVRGLVEALIPSRGGRDEAHWINGARMFVEALLMFLVVGQDLPDRHLVRLHTLAFGSAENLFNVFDVLRNLAVIAAAQGKYIDPDIARVCKSYGNWWFGREEKEKSYFLSIAEQELTWLGDTVWQKILTGNDAAIDPKGEPTTVYLVLPWKRLRANRNWLRVMVASLINTVIDTPGLPRTPVLFMLDEAFLGLGRMELILEAAAILRNEGGRIALVYQDMLQLKSLYADEWESFIASAGAQLFFAVNDMTGARYVSDRLGMETRFVQGSPQGQGRQLKQASEVLTIQQDEIICFLRGLHPARFGRIDVRNDTHFDKILDPNPRYRPVVAQRGLPDQQVVCNFVSVDLDAPIPKNARQQQSEYNDQGDDEVIYTETGKVWTGEEKPLPPPPKMMPNELQAAHMGAALSEQFKKYVFWSEIHNSFGYLDFGAFVPVG